MSEVDYFFADADSGADPFSLLPMLNWEDLPTSQTLTHRGLGIEYLPSPNSATPPPQQPRTRPPWSSPPYHSTDWHKVAASIERELCRVKSAISSPTASATVSYLKLERALATALDTSIPNTPPKSVPLPPPGAPRASGDAAARSRAKAASIKPRLPPDVAALLRHAKAVQAQLQRATAAGAEHALLKQSALKAHKAATRAYRKHHRRTVFLLAKQLSSARKQDAKKFFEQLQSTLAPSSPHLHAEQSNTIPDEPGQAPAQQRFSASFADLYSTRAPLPPGLADPRWMQYVPPGPAAPELGRPFTPQELAQVLFSPSACTGWLCPATGTHNHSCSLCSATVEAGVSYGGRADLHNSPPSPSPIIKTSSSYSGEPRLHARHLRWARHSSAARNAAYQLLVCTCLCVVLNKTLTEQRMPAGTAVYIYNAIYKGKGSRADPDNYRFIAVSKLFTRILGLLLAARLSHWSQLHNIVPSRHQGAFLPHAGTEWHPWAVLEAIKTEWRRNRSVYLLYVDFKKAYDSVHPEALCIVLKRYGVPDNIIGLLRHWSNSRTGRLLVNGQLTAGTPIAMGTGQGDTPSCVLFNIYFASLARYLETVPEIGISPAGVSIKSLLFADDVNIPAYTPEGVTAGGNATLLWGAAFGMTINVGPTKTAAMAFPSPLRRALVGAPSLPIITLSNGQVVTWVEKYRYLGLVVDPELSLKHLTSGIAGTLTGACIQYFGYNSVLHSADATTRHQVFMTTVLGSINFLLCLLPLTAKTMAAIDKTIRITARTFLQLPYGSPTWLAMLESGLPSARELLYRARYQFFFSMLLTPHKAAPAPSLFRALILQHHLFRLPRDPATSSWAHDTFASFMEGVERGAALPPTGRLSQIAPHSRVFSQRLAHVELLGQTAPLRSAVTLSSQRPPASAAPKQHFLDTHLNLSAPLSLRGSSGNATPLSWTGGRGSGHPLTLTSNLIPRSHIAMLAIVRLGAAGLHYKPLAPTSWLFSETTSPSQWRAGSHGTHCPFCAPLVIADPWHILLECTHPAVVASRVELYAAASRFLPHLLTRIEAAARGFQCENAVRHLTGACMPLARALDWSSPANSFLLYRLCTAMPYSSFNVPPGPPSATLLLGQTLDVTLLPSNCVRRIYNSWVPWAAANTISMVKPWTQAVDALGGYFLPGIGRCLFRTEALQSQPPRYAPFIIPS